MWKRPFCATPAVLILLSSSSAAPLPAQEPLFSEDFESGRIDPKVWEERTHGAATIAVEEGEAAHGKYALRIHYPETASQSFAFIVAPNLPVVLQDHFFGRAYVKIDSAMPPSHTVFLFAGVPGWPFSKFEEIGASQGTFQASFQENKSILEQNRGEDVRHGEALPVGKWFLLEWECSDDPATLTIWVDGQKSQVTEGGRKVDFASFKWPPGSEMAKGLVGGFEEFGVGVRVRGDVPRAFDVYYDDIAIGTARIGEVKWHRESKTASLAFHQPEPAAN